MRAEPVDFSIAVLVQAQVEAEWFGVYVSVDPRGGDAGGALADLSDRGPSALVDGAGATLRARRRDGRWSGVDPSMGESLEAVHRAAARLGAYLDGPVDVEFALHRGDDEPVILQCRPITHPPPDPAIERGGGGAGWRGRACAGGRAVGLAIDARAGDDSTGDRPTGDGPRIAVVDRLTTADYGIVFGNAGVVTEQDASPLSHVGILCRELGVPFVCGIDGAVARLAGRRVALDGGSGEVEILHDAVGPAATMAAASPAAPPPPPPATISGLELLLRLLVERRPGHPPAEEADRILRHYARAVGAPSTEVTASPVGPGELEVPGTTGHRPPGPGFLRLRLPRRDRLSTCEGARSLEG